MIKEAYKDFKAMPTWQKILTGIGVVTVGVSITILTSKGVKFGVQKWKNHQEKKELGEKIDQLADLAHDVDDPEFKSLVNDLVTDAKVLELAGRDAKVISLDSKTG